MSILYYIKDPIPFIILGGISGIGKTSIIDFLLSEYPHAFSQPKSYTTRTGLDKNDRYEFLTKEEIQRMYNNGLLLNLDEVHGEYYGMDINSIERIKLSGKIPIKEIHPKSFDNFRVQGLDTINILIENKHLAIKSVPFVQRQNRMEEDFDIEGYKGYDIRINIAGLSPAEAAKYLLLRILAFRLHTFLFEHPTLIEDVNKSGYDRIADEFHDHLRITTKNFHDVSRGFWEDTVFSKLNADMPGLEILELGPGNGWLFKSIKTVNQDIYGVDISDKMQPAYCRKLFGCSARNLPFKANYFDLVVGSLIDPFLIPEVFAEVERVLKPNGKFIFTIPSSEWARNLTERQRVNKTIFEKKDGEKVEVFSFCDTMYLQPFLMSFSNLEIYDSTYLCLGTDYKGPISSAITKSATNAGKSVSYFPIVAAFSFKKTL